MRLLRRRPTLVEVLATRTQGLDGELVDELVVACGRQDAEWALDLWEQASVRAQRSASTLNRPVRPAAPRL